MAFPASLERLIGPPVATPRAVDWARVADEYGLVFPADYRAFVECYPPIEFYEFLFLYHPTALDWNLFDVLEPQLEQATEFLRRTRRSAGGYDPRTGNTIPPGPAVDYPLYPHPGGLLPWGVTVNNQKCLWLTH